MKTILLFLIMTFAAVTYALGWGAFSGYNASNELITLVPSHNTDSPSDSNIEDIYSSVYIGTKTSQYAKELNDLCHRYKNTKQNDPDIWCDGNKDSPLHGATYRWLSTITDPSDEDYSDIQIWQCVEGCSSRAPKEMTYAY